MDDLPKLTTENVIGIAVAISGNILISLALNLQKLAHKRLDVQKSGHVNGHVQKRPLATPRRNPSRGPSLNEQDEDSDTVTEHASPSRPRSPAPELQPLLPVIDHSRSYTSLEREDDSLEREPQKTGFFNRIFRSKKSTKKKKHAAILPVDVLAEDTAMRGSRPPEQTNDEEDAAQTNETAYLKSKLWWSGFVLMNVGEFGNFLSYAFAPASVVAPLGTFALTANCLFAPLMLGEHFRKRDFVGICLAILGAVTVVLSSNASDTRLNPRQLLEAIKQTAFLIYAGIYLGGAIILAGLSQGRLGRTYVFIDVGLCALFGGFTVLSTKALSTLITLEWYGVFAEWITYPLILTLLGTGIGQIRYLNRALMRFDGKTVIPVQFVFFTLSAIIGSAILYGDFRKAGFHAIVTFLYGCLATFAGVFILAHGTGNEREEPTAHAIEPSDNAENGTRLGMGTIGKRQRATLVLPSGMEPTRLETPTLRRKRSGVGVVGISPAQQLLLVHTPTRESHPIPREWEAGYEAGDRETASTPSSYGRNRSLHGFGNDGGEFLNELDRLHAIFGSVVRVGPNELHFNDPSAYNDIYSHKFKLRKEPSFYKCFGVDRSTFGTVDPHEAKERRNILGPLFSRRSVIEAEAQIQELVKKLVERINCTDGPCNLFLGFRCATLDMITSFCFGVEIGALESEAFVYPLLAAIHASVPFLFLIKSFPWIARIPSLCPSFILSRISPAFRLQTFIRGQIKVLIDFAMGTPLVADERRFSSVYQRLFSMHRTPAGSDTVGNTCTVGTFHVLQNPTIRQKLIQELFATFPADDMRISLIVLQKLPYLTAVIKESLRLSHGFVSPLPRLIDESDRYIAGIRVPGGTVVGMSVTEIHNNGALFSDPRKFNPERWLQPESSVLERYLTPFSKGPRMCLGINLAWMELYLIFGIIFRRLDMELVGHDSNNFDSFKDYFIPVHQGHLYVKTN
ncbi:hypothetical protein NP233_g1274 [Leucocoprinus birnbaumii]|uniref:Cytochrome P450 n=1 Tax=Leucocoprinus birnbaumii TaxID=56174 RepID=A0AAD5YVZ6_9AGAR|nr:hypothetical protein NP233_g1274 [Leucocoprinus birnbaumii]